MTKERELGWHLIPQEQHIKQDKQWTLKEGGLLTWTISTLLDDLKFSFSNDDTIFQKNEEAWVDYIASHLDKTKICDISNFGNASILLDYIVFCFCTKKI